MAKYVREEIYRAWQFKYDGVPEPSKENYLTIPDWVLAAISNGFIKYKNNNTLLYRGITVNIGDYIVKLEYEYNVYTKEEFEKLFKKIED